MAASTALSAVADELYALAPEDFTAARDAASRRARDAGNRELASDIKQLRRPSVGAWLVNALVHSRPEQLDELFDVGAALREARDALDGAELRAMSGRRHQLIRALSNAARELAATAGHRVADAAQREFESTLDAALADEQAEDAVRTGRLMRALTSSGLETVDLAGAVAAPGSVPPPRRRAHTTAAAERKQVEQPAAAQQRDAAEQAVRDARAELTRAESELAGRESELDRARTAVELARGRIAELDAALTEAVGQQSAAEKSRRDADQATRTALRARDAAQRALDAAQKKAAR